MIRRVVDFGRMIKFSHTIFALPFALTAAVLAAREHGMTWGQLGWIVAAMVGARTAAMGFNRIVDAQYDAQNPRTQNREIPRGQVTRRQASIFVILSSVVLILSSYYLNRLCFYLSPVALAVVFFYSYTKRFTSYSHVFLGIALGLAPIGAWMAISGEWSWRAVGLGATVLAWVSGFDIIYACQDAAFDREHRLFSLPSRWGIGAALRVSRLLHVLTVVGLVLVGWMFGLGVVYYAGVFVIGAVLVYEQSLVRPTDLSRVNLAFFNLNGVISLVFFLATLVDLRIA